MLTPEFVAAHRALLVARLERTQVRLRAVEDHLQRKNREMPKDVDDQATEREGDETLDALDDLARAEIASTRLALTRIDEGTWGTCVRCGGAIAEARLAAVPDTAVCIGCAT